jgi:hypothetical protein
MTQDTNTWSNSPAARAARSVPEHPQPLCDGFVPQPIPAKFWCRNCGWNRPLHGDDEFRQAVAAELAKRSQAATR